MPERSNVRAKNRHAGPAGTGLEESLAAVEDLGTASSQASVGFSVTCLHTMRSHEPRSCPMHNQLPMFGQRQASLLGHGHESGHELWMPLATCLLDLHGVPASVIVTVSTLQYSGAYQSRAGFPARNVTAPGIQLAFERLSAGETQLLCDVE
jgi:hypothetical protein